MTRAARAGGAGALAGLLLVACSVSRAPAPESTASLRVAGVRRLMDRPAQSPAAWAADSGAVVYAAAGALWESSLAGATRRIAAAGVVTSLAWSAASGAIAYVDRGAAWVVRDRAAPRRIRVEGFATEVAWDSDGGRAAVVTLRGAGASQRAVLWVASADGRYVRRVVESRAIHDVAWFPNGLYLFYVDGETLWTRRFRGPDARSVRSPVAPVQRAVLSPTGGAVALVGGEGGEVYVLRPDGSGLRRIGAASAASGPSWSPRGDKIAYAARVDEATAEIWIADAVGGGARLVERYQVEFPDPALTLVTAWSPDGRKLAFGTNTGSFTGPVWVASFERR